MNRAVLILSLVIALPASAAPRGWSVPLRPGWVEDTAKVMADPGMIGFARQFTDHGDLFEGTAYRTADGSVMLVVATVEPLEKPPSLAMLEDTEVKARERANQGGTEASYVAERTPLLIGATHRVAGKLAPMGNRRFIGLLPSGQARLVVASCIGEPVICDPVLASIKVDEAALVQLATLPAEGSGGGLRARRIGLVIGALAVAGALVLMLRRRRQR